MEAASVIFLSKKVSVTTSDGAGSEENQSSKVSRESYHFMQVIDNQFDLPRW